MGDNPFAFPGDINDVGNWSKGLLAVPDNAIASEWNGKTYAKWVETVQINDVVFQSPPEKPMRNAEPGDETGLFIIKATVDPIGGGKNVGRRIQARVFFNMTALRERPESGHAKMTSSSFGTLVSLANALGLPSEAAGAGPEALATQYKPELIGKRARVSVEREEPTPIPGVEADPDARVFENFRSWVRYA